MYNEYIRQIRSSDIAAEKQAIASMAPPVAGFELNANGVPDFDALPLRKGDPRLAAWGLYGDKDELGFLNRLTDERVAAAAREEIKSGKRYVSWSSSSHYSSRSFNH